MTQHNLGLALAALGAIEHSLERLDEAIAACRKALKVRTRKRMPIDWAMTQVALGQALTAMGERASGPEQLEQGVAAYRKALDVFDRAGATFYSEQTRKTLARVEALLAERRGLAP